MAFKIISNGCFYIAGEAINHYQCKISTTSALNVFMWCIITSKTWKSFWNNFDKIIIKYRRWIYTTVSTQFTVDMFKVVYRPNKSRKRQHGLRDFKITKWKCFCKAFVEALRSFCTTSSFVPLRFAFETGSRKADA